MQCPEMTCCLFEQGYATHTPDATYKMWIKPIMIRAVTFVQYLCTNYVTIQDEQRTHIAEQRHCKDVRDEVDVRAISPEHSKDKTYLK